MEFLKLKNVLENDRTFLKQNDGSGVHACADILGKGRLFPKKFA